MIKLEEFIKCCNKNISCQIITTNGKIISTTDTEILKYKNSEVLSFGTSKYGSIIDILVLDKEGE